jgi:hypothetical protein
MPKPRYDVFEFDEPAFELVSDAEMHSGRPDPTADNIGDDDEGTEIAHAVTAATAVELVGLSPACIDRHEREVAEHGVCGVGNLLENFEVRRTRDEP